METWIAEAIELQKSGKPEEALSKVEGLLSEQGENRLALFVRGCLRMGLDDIANGIKDWEQALEADLAFAAGIAEQYPSLVQGAFYTLNLELSVEANNPAVHSAVGRANRLFGRFDEAVPFLTRATELGRSFWRDGVLCAELQHRMGHSDLALQSLNQLLESQPENAEIHYHIGRLYQSQGSTAFALRHLEKASTLDAQDLRVHLALGEIYTFQGRFDQGESRLKICIDQGPTARAYLGMAECVRGQYRFDEALEYLKKAVEAEPRNLKALSELGNLALQFGDLDLGVDCLKRSLEIEPNQAEVYSLLAKAAQQKGDRTQAIESLQKLLDLSPKDGVASHNLGNLLRTDGNFIQAVSRLESALELLPQDPQVALDLSDCYINLDRTPEALALLKSSYERHPNSKELRAALTSLDPTSLQQEKASSLDFFRQSGQEDFNPWLQAEPEANAVVAEVQAPDDVSEPGPVSQEPDPEEPVAQPPVAEVAPLTFEEHRDRARDFSAEGKKNEALQAYRSALALQPRDRECLTGLSRLYADRGLLGPACDFMQQAYALDPSDFSLLPELINWLARADDMEREETMSGVILCIPATLDRKGLLSYLWNLRNSEQVDALIELVAQGVLSRFPSDADCREHWEQLNSASLAQALTTMVDPVHEDNASLDAHVESAPVVDEPPVVEEEAAPVVDEPPVVAEETAPVVEEPLVVAEEAAPVVEEPPVVAEEAAPVLDEPPVLAEEAAPVVDESPVLAQEAAPVVDEPPVIAEEAAPVVDESPVIAEETAAVVDEPPVIAQEAAAVVDEPPMIAQEAAPVVDEPPVIAEEAVVWEIEKAVSPSIKHLEEWVSLLSSVTQPELGELYRRFAAELEGRGFVHEACFAMLQALRHDPERGGQWLAQKLEVAVDASRAAGLSSEARAMCQGWAALFPEDASAQRHLSQLEPAVAPVTSDEVVDVSDVLAQETPAEIEIEAVVEQPSVVEESAVVQEADLAQEAAGKVEGPRELSELLDALSANPGDEALLQQAFEAGKGRDEELLAYFRALTRDNASESLHIRNFARLYLHLGKPILAVVQYQKFLVTSPSEEGYLELANIYTGLKRERNAAEAMRKAEELKSASVS